MQQQASAEKQKQKELEELDAEIQKEYASLEGVMGGHYARRAGEDPMRPCAIDFGRLFGGVYLFNFRVANYANLIEAEELAEGTHAPLAVRQFDFCRSQVPPQHVALESWAIAQHEADGAFLRLRAVQRLGQELAPLFAPPGELLDRHAKIVGQLAQILVVFAHAPVALLDPGEEAVVDVLADASQALAAVEIVQRYLGGQAEGT